MFNDEEYITAKGVILSRKAMGENNLWVTLFLEDAGLVSLSSKNFMGDSEPLSWGYFFLQKMKRGAKYFIHDTDIRDDMLKLRQGRESFLAAMNWSKALMKYLPAEQPDNDLLQNLYWSMRLLTVPVIPAEAVSWRFFWLWLDVWGLAPELETFHASNSFNPEEISLLSQLAALQPQEVTQLFTGSVSPNIRENIFKVAIPLAKNFLNEK